MQPTNRVSGFEAANNADYEAPDVFCGLASLIVEGRLPRYGGRGYGEGTHVPIGTKGHRHHVCSEENTMVRNDQLEMGMRYTLGSKKGYLLVIGTCDADLHTK